VSESIKALQIVKKIETQGVRCNLNILWHITNIGCNGYVMKVRIKSANEKMNISKLAFPLCHPSMLRRLCFRFLETYPTIESKYTFGYGRPAKLYETKSVITDEYVIPAIFAKDIDEVNNLSDIS
jgi:hypothetical protein